MIQNRLGFLICGTWILKHLMNLLKLYENLGLGNFCGERPKYFRTLLKEFEDGKRLKLHIREKILAKDFWS